MFKCHKHLQPALINKRFENNAEIHNYNTRKKANLYQKNAMTTLKRFCLSIVGVTMFNNLPDIVKMANTLNMFKNKLKTFLMLDY